MNDHEPKQIDGVCCQYCINFEQPLCPVQTASPWSRWGNWCNAYHPNPNMPEARPLPDAKDPDPDCQAKQETINKLRDTVQMNNHTADYLIAKCDRLRTALAGLVGGSDDESLGVIEWQVKRGRGFTANRTTIVTAIKAMRDTKP